MSMGMEMNSWYDIVGLDERSNENCRGIEDSRARIAGILENEHKQLGIPYNRMVLLGFSQGGALSLYTGLQLPAAGPGSDESRNLAGVVCLSGYLPHAKQFKLTPGMETVPVFHGHGLQDGVVPVSGAYKSQTYVKEQGLKDYTLKTYPIGHTVSMTEIADVQKFLQSILPPDDSVKVRLPDPQQMSVKELKAAIREAGLSHKAIGLMEKEEFVKLLKEHYGSDPNKDRSR
jgi:lysophospholipase II